MRLNVTQHGFTWPGSFKVKIYKKKKQTYFNIFKIKQKVQNKMTLTEFIENLKGLNNGSNFPEVLLESLYSAIKNEPLECAR